jgi:hypothetical protein
VRTNEYVSIVVSLVINKKYVIEIEKLQMSLEDQLDVVHRAHKRRKTLEDDKKSVKDKKATNESVKKHMEKYALFSQGAYIQHDTNRQKVMDDFDTGYEYDVESSTANFAVYKKASDSVGGDADVVVAFRGTSKWNDWIANARIMGDKIENSPRYRRISRKFKKIQEKYKDQNIVVTGHSLGGAIAAGIGAQYKLPSITFNPGSGMSVVSKKKQDLGDSIQYTTNGSGTLDPVSWLSSVSTRPGEKIEVVGQKDLKRWFPKVSLKAHGLDNFLPKEPSDGYYEAISKDESGRFSGIINKGTEAILDMGISEKMHDSIDWMKDFGEQTWEKFSYNLVSMGLVGLAVKRGVLTMEQAQNLKDFAAFMANPSGVAADGAMDKVGALLKKPKEFIDAIKAAKNGDHSLIDQFFKRTRNPDVVGLDDIELSDSDWGKIQADMKKTTVEWDKNKKVFDPSDGEAGPFDAKKIMAEWEAIPEGPTKPTFGDFMDQKMKGRGVKPSGDTGPFGPHTRAEWEAIPEGPTKPTFGEFMDQKLRSPPISVGAEEPTPPIKYRGPKPPPPKAPKPPKGGIRDIHEPALKKTTFDPSKSYKVIDPRTGVELEGGMPHPDEVANLRKAARVLGLPESASVEEISQAVASRGGGAKSLPLRMLDKGTQMPLSMVTWMSKRGGKLGEFGTYLLENGQKIGRGVTATVGIGGAVAGTAMIIYGGVSLAEMHKNRKELKEYVQNHPEDIASAEFFKIQDAATDRNDAYFGVNTAIGTVGIASSVAIGGTALGFWGGSTAAAALAGPIGWAALGMGAVVGAFTYIYESEKTKQEYRKYLTKLYGNSSTPSLDFYLDKKNPALLMKLNTLRDYVIPENASPEFRRYVEHLKQGIESAYNPKYYVTEGEEPREAQLAGLVGNVPSTRALELSADYYTLSNAQHKALGIPPTTTSLDAIRKHAEGLQEQIDAHDALGIDVPFQNTQGDMSNWFDKDGNMIASPADLKMIQDKFASSDKKYNEVYPPPPNASDYGSNQRAYDQDLAKWRVDHAALVKKYKAQRDSDLALRGTSGNLQGDDDSWHRKAPTGDTGSAGEEWRYSDYLKTYARIDERTGVRFRMMRLPTADRELYAQMKGIPVSDLPEGAFQMSDQDFDSFMKEKSRSFGVYKDRERAEKENPKVHAQFGPAGFSAKHVFIIDRSSEKDTQGGSKPEIDKNIHGPYNSKNAGPLNNSGKNTNDPNSNKNDRLDRYHDQDAQRYQLAYPGKPTGTPQGNRMLDTPIQGAGGATYTWNKNSGMYDHWGKHGEYAFSSDQLPPSVRGKVDPETHRMRTNGGIGGASQPLGGVPVEHVHTAPDHPRTTPVHMAPPGENHDPFQSTHNSESTFSSSNSKGISLRQIHLKSHLKNRINQQMMTAASDVNFMRVLNRREGNW